MDQEVIERLTNKRLTSYIHWENYNEHNLNHYFSGLVDQVKKDHDLILVVQILVLTDYKPPRSSGHLEYVRNTNYKIMASTLKTQWVEQNTINGLFQRVRFIPGNISKSAIIKFFPMANSIPLGL